MTYLGSMFIPAMDCAAPLKTTLLEPQPVARREVGGILGERHPHTDLPWFPGRKGTLGSVPPFMETNRWQSAYMERHVWRGRGQV